MNKWERWISGSSWRESRSVQGRESWRKRGKELGIMMASGKAEWAGQKAEADRGMEGKGPISARGAVWKAWVAEGQIGAAGKKADETGVKGGAAWWPGRTEPPGNESQETGYLLHLHTLLLMLTNPWINHVNLRCPLFNVLKIWWNMECLLTLMRWGDMHHQGYRYTSEKPNPFYVLLYAAQRKRFGHLYKWCKTSPNTNRIYSRLWFTRRRTFRHSFAILFKCLLLPKFSLCK